MVFELLFLYMYLRICRSRNLVVFLYTIYDISFEILVVPCSMEINNASQVSKHFQSLPVNTIFHIIHRFIYLFIYFPLSPYVHLLFICTKPFHSTNFFLHLSLRIRTCPSSHTLIKRSRERFERGIFSLLSGRSIDVSARKGERIEEQKKLIYFTFVAHTFCLDPTDPLVERVLNDRSSSLGLANEARPVLRSLYFPTHSATVSRESR